MILLEAIKETGHSLDNWILRCKQPLTPHQSITRDGDPDGPLVGEVAVFTGAVSIPRHEAADLAARAGCEVNASVTKETTLLAVGDQDARRLASGEKKSSKHVKAEALVAKGQIIRIVRESDFLKLIEKEGSN